MNRCLLVAALGLAALRLAPADAAPALQACRLRGVEHDALCGSVSRPLDPARPDDGRQIDVHFAVLPAVARNKKSDPVFFFAGGPGQSAIAIAGGVSALLGRFANRRDVVLIDQRGTGASAPLRCDDEAPTRPLREQFDLSMQLQQLRQCRKALQKLPYGDLRQFTTTIAMQDADAVRVALGAARIDLIGGSYGTRAVLEYMRLFPQAVRRAVIDGVAPPDMVLPQTFAPDAQAAFDALLVDCEKDADCRAHYPTLRERWHALLASLPREVTVHHPLTDLPETLTITRDTLAGLVRGPLYVPLLNSALPFAVEEAVQGRFEALVGLASGLSGGRALALAQGMHFSVVCAEDAPLMTAAAADAASDFGDGVATLYRRVCADWPRGAVTPAFYTLPPAPAATLVLSGGIDPVTPPRHGTRVARALGAKARHVIVAHAGHGVMGLGCMRDVVFRFVDAASDELALKVDAGCAAGLPRPPAFEPVRAGAAR